MTTLTVYGTPISTYVRTTRMLLEAAGADYTLQPVDIFNGECQSAEYLVKHPFGKIPALEADGAVIYETAAITQYLDATVGQHQFSPADPLMQARMRQIMAIVDSYLYSPAISTIVIQRLIVPSQGGQPDEAKVSSAVPLAKTAAEAIEALITGSPYLVGSNATIADFYLIPVFIYLSKTPEFAAITADTPRLREWWSQAQQLPVVSKVCS